MYDRKQNRVDLKSIIGKDRFYVCSQFDCCNITEVFIVNYGLAK